VIRYAKNRVRSAGRPCQVWFRPRAIDSEQKLPLANLCVGPESVERIAKSTGFFTVVETARTWYDILHSTVKWFGAIVAPAANCAQFVLRPVQIVNGGEAVGCKVAYHASV